MPPLPDGPRSAPSRPPPGLSRLADTQSGARHARVNCRTRPPYFVDHLSVVAPPSATPGSHVRSTGRPRSRLSHCLERASAPSEIVDDLLIATGSQYAACT